MKRVFSLILRISVSVVLILFLLRRVELPVMIKIIRGLDIKFFLLAFFVFLFSYSLGIFRWVILIRSSSLNPPISRIITAFCGGLFFNTFLPSTIGGDVFRTMDLFSHTKEGSKILATVFLDRLSGFVALMMIAFLSLLIGYRFLDDKLVVLSIVILFVLFLIILAVAFSRRIFKLIVSLMDFLRLKGLSERLYKFHTAIVEFRTKPQALLKILLISLFIQTGGILVFYFIARALGISLKMIYFFIIIPIIGAISVLPISIGGLGLRDSSSIIYLGRFGVAEEAALSLSLLAFLFFTVIGILGGIIYVLALRNRRIQPH